MTLPEDFCLREVRATDPDDLDAVYDFVTHWVLDSSKYLTLAPLALLPARRAEK